jgi:hypothetical protein
VAKESKKLVNKEDDCKLNGDVTNTPPSRTRKGGNGRPKLAKDYSPEVVVVAAPNSRRVTASSAVLSELDSSQDSDWTPTHEEMSEESEEEFVGKPPATRVIVEVSSVTALMEKTC